MCAENTQIDLTIKHIFLSSQLLSTHHNFSLARTHNSIYHLHKTIIFLNKATTNFGNTQEKYSRKYSRDIH